MRLVFTLNPLLPLPPSVDECQGEVRVGRTKIGATSVDKYLVYFIWFKVEGTIMKVQHGMYTDPFTALNVANWLHAQTFEVKSLQGAARAFIEHLMPAVIRYDDNCKELCPHSSELEVGAERRGVIWDSVLDVENSSKTLCTTISDVPGFGSVISIGPQEEGSFEVLRVAGRTYLSDDWTPGVFWKSRTFRPSYGYEASLNNGTKILNPFSSRAKVLDKHVFDEVVGAFLLRAQNVAKSRKRVRASVPVVHVDPASNAAGSSAEHAAVSDATDDAYVVELDDGVASNDTSVSALPFKKRFLKSCACA
jgi:hypothetical protein